MYKTLIQYIKRNPLKKTLKNLKALFSGNIITKHKKLNKLVTDQLHCLYPRSYSLVTKICNRNSMKKIYHIVRTSREFFEDIRKAMV